MDVYDQFVDMVNARSQAAIELAGLPDFITEEVKVLPVGGKPVPVISAHQREVICSMFEQACIFYGGVPVL